MGAEPRVGNDVPKVQESSEKKRAAATSKRCMVGIRGNWYDLTDFIPEHPGGDILWKFNEMDATEQFTAFHVKRGILARGSKYKTGKTYRRPNDPAKEEYAQLARRFISQGLVLTDAWGWVWNAWNVARVFAFLAAALYVARLGWNVFGGVLLFFFWQQAGGLMHDAGHSNITHDMDIDRWLGLFFGTVCIGVQSAWWTREHHIHHALTNAYTTEPETQSSKAFKYPMPDKSRRGNSDVPSAYAVDYQMKEDAFAQSVSALPTFPKAVTWILRFQHFYSIAGLILIGRIHAVSDSWKRGAPLREWIALGVHIGLTYLVLSTFPDGWSAFKFYATASVCEGILHIQLVCNHYLNDWALDESIANDFVRWAFIVSHNVAGPAWTDWFHVGLNLHIEHHLFPKVSRVHLRKIKPIVQKFGKKYGLPYRELMPVPVLDLQRQFKKVANSL